jgi:uncharacterized membrane protein
MNQLHFSFSEPSLFDFQFSGSEPFFAPRLKQVPLSFGDPLQQVLNFGNTDRRAKQESVTGQFSPFGSLQRFHNDGGEKPKISMKGAA